MWVQSANDSGDSPDNRQKARGSRQTKLNGVTIFLSRNKNKVLDKKACVDSWRQEMKYGVNLKATINLKQKLVFGKS